MRIEKIGVIKSMNLPDSFARGEVLAGGMGQNWRKVFHPKDAAEAEDVSITSYYRGSPALAPDGRTFRTVLGQPPGVLFSSNSDESHPQARTIINALTDALGHAGNNQLTNQEEGLGGPRFFLQRMETLELNEKKVLAVYGVFHDLNKIAQNFYVGVFVDSKPKQKECCIEELVFEAQTRELYEKYHNEFEQSLKTIVWN